MYFEQKICDRCGKDFKGEGRGPSTCETCRMKKATAERNIYFTNLNRLTLEERIRRVEEWIYNYSPPVDPNDIKY